MHFNSCMGDSNEPVRCSAVQKSHFLETVQKQSVDGLLSSRPGGGSPGASPRGREQGSRESTAGSF